MHADVGKTKQSKTNKHKTNQKKSLLLESTASELKLGICMRIPSAQCSWSLAFWSTAQSNTQLPYQMFRASSVPCKCLTSNGMFWLIFIFF